jgi:hypothetical protein
VNGQRAARALALVAAAAVLVAAVLLLLDARAASDDYALAARGRSEGVLGVLAAFHAHWSGRWALFLFGTGALTLLDPFEHYAVLLLGVWSLLALGLAALVRALLGPAAPRRAVAAGTLIAFALAFGHLDAAAASETFFWFTGGLPYLASTGLVLFVAGRLLVERAPGRGPGRAETVALGLAAAVAAGLQEVVGLIAVSVLGVAAVHALATRSARRPAALVAALAALVGFAVVVLAPGNAERAALEFARAPAVATTAANLLREAGARALAVLQDPSLLAAAGLVALVARQQAPVLRTSRLVVAGTCLAAPLVALGAALHVTGGWLPARLHAAVALLCAAGLLVGVATVCRTGRARAHAPSAPAPVLGGAFAPVIRGAFAPVLFGALAAGLLATGNGRRALAEVVDGRPQRYAAALDAALADARAAAGDGARRHALPAPPSRPRLYPHQGLTGDPDWWANRRLAELLGLEALVADW